MRAQHASREGLQSHTWELLGYGFQRRGSHQGGDDADVLLGRPPGHQLRQHAQNGATCRSIPGGWTPCPCFWSWAFAVRGGLFLVVSDSFSSYIAWQSALLQQQDSPLATLRDVSRCRYSAQ